MTKPRAQTWCQWVILILALFLRWPLAEPHWYHGDEWAFTVHPLGFWSGDLNPHFFNYPTLQFYFNSIVYYLYYLLFSDEAIDSFIAYRYFVQDADLIAIARGISTLAAVATVAVAMRIGTTLYGTKNGLLAGLFLAAMPLHVRFSHLAIVDVPAALWTTLAVLFAIRIAQNGCTSSYLSSGVFIGLAAATKYPAALVAVPVLVASLIDRPTLKNVRLWLTAGIALAIFALVTPFVWLDFGKFWADLSSMAQSHLLGPPHPKSMSSWSEILRTNLRFGLGIMGLAALALSLASKRKLWQPPELVLLTAVVAFLWLLALSESTFMRYALPLAPLLAVQITRPLAGVRMKTTAITAVILLIEPLHSTLHARALLSGVDTRDKTAEWMMAQPNRQRRVFSTPSCGGDVTTLDPRHVAKREMRFALSFGLEQLRHTYQLLSVHPDLPPFYSLVSREYVEAFSDNAGTKQDSVLVLWYRHPLCVGGPDSLATDRLLSRVNWQAEFSAGELNASVFDRMDAFFVPVGGWSGVQASGPSIRVGKLPIRSPTDVPDGGKFFSLLLHYYTGYLASQESDWPAVATAYETILETPIYLNEFLSLARIYKLLLGLGVAHYHLGQVDIAIDVWQQATELVPESAEAYVSLGKAYRDRGQATEAIHHLQQALERKPNDDQLFFVFHALGMSFMDLGRFADAVPVLARAVEVRADPDAYFSYGLACMQVGFDERAIDAFSKILEFDPAHVAARRMLHLNDR